MVVPGRETARQLVGQIGGAEAVEMQENWMKAICYLNMELLRSNRIRVLRAPRASWNFVILHGSNNFAVSILEAIPVTTRQHS